MQSEKLKMINGLPYEPWDHELCKDREYAKDLLFTYNAIRPSNRQERKALLEQLIDAKDQFHIESPFYCDYGYNIHIGSDFYANHNCVILDGASVTIGDRVLFAPNVAIYTAGHPMHHEVRATGMEYALSVTIGDDVWIGGDTVINPGVTIGQGSVIGSGSVVNKDIPPFVIAVGNPIRIIRNITDADKDYYYKNQNF